MRIMIFGEIPEKLEQRFSDDRIANPIGPIENDHMCRTQAHTISLLEKTDDVPQRESYTEKDPPYDITDHAASKRYKARTHNTITHHICNE